MANGIETLNEQRASPSAAQRLAYSVDHAAERIDGGRTKVWELIHDGRLQAVKIDGRTLITEAALNELLAQSPHAART